MATDDPGLAARGAESLRGLCYLATTKKDGSPRVHPVVPLLGEGRIFFSQWRLSMTFLQFLASSGSAKSWLRGIATHYFTLYYNEFHFFEILCIFERVATYRDEICALAGFEGSDLCPQAK